MAKNIRAKIQELYLNGVEINDICTSLNISRTSFYYHKNSDLKKGINWDTLALNSFRSEDNIKDKEAKFLTVLISSFEKFIQKNDELDEKILDKLHQYAQTYWRLKAPKQDDFSLQNKLEAVARATIEGIAKLALEEQNKEVAEFLSKNADEIIKRVFRKGKK